MNFTINSSFKILNYRENCKIKSCSYGNSKFVAGRNAILGLSVEPVKPVKLGNRATRQLESLDIASECVIRNIEQSIFGFRRLENGKRIFGLFNRDRGCFLGIRNPVIFL